MNLAEVLAYGFFGISMGYLFLAVVRYVNFRRDNPSASRHIEADTDIDDTNPVWVARVYEQQKKDFRKNMK